MNRAAKLERNFFGRRRWLTRWLAPCLQLATVTAAARPSEGEQNDPVAAEALFRAGRAAAARGEVKAACMRFQDSYRLDPAPGTLLNLADCRQQLGQLAQAWAHYQHALDALKPEDDRVPEIRQRLADLESRVPKLTLSLRAGTPPSAQIRRNGVLVSPSSLGVPIPVDPGTHTIVVTSKGHAPRRDELSIAEGQTVHHYLELGERLEPRRPVLLQPLPRGSQPVERAGIARPIGYVALGAGAASLVAASVLGWRYLEARARVDEHCPTQYTCDDEGVRAAGRAEFLQTAVAVSGTFAAAGIGTGVALLVWVAPSQDHSPGGAGSRASIEVVYGRAF